MQIRLAGQWRSSFSGTQFDAMHDRINSRSDAETESARSAIVFLAELMGELSGIARQHRFDALAYLLDMAKLEAESIRHELHGDQ